MGSGAGAGISICGLDAPAGASTPLGRINHRTQITQKTRPARKPIKRTGLKPGFGVADCADTPGICGMSVLKRWDRGSGWFAIREFLLDNAAQQHKPAGSAHRHFWQAIVVPAKRTGNRRMESVLSPCRA
jgi:hypothetical protein